MPGMAEIHYSGVRQVIDAYTSDADQVMELVERTTGQAMLNMKKGAQRRVRGHKHLTRLAWSYTYDVWRWGGRGVIGEVGAEHSRGQGPLDVIIEYGSPTSAPLPHWAPEAEKEIPAWERFVEHALLKDLE